MYPKRSKKLQINDDQASETFYDEAFKLFAEGFSNERIEKYNPKANQLSITQLLYPSIEMVLDELESYVTKNVHFRKNTSYFVKRKDFISDIINKRNSKAISKDEMQFFNEFLRICQFYHTHRSLNEYVYLKLELIFDRIYYSDKKINIKKIHVTGNFDEQQEEEMEVQQEILPIKPNKKPVKAKDQSSTASRQKEEKKVVPIPSKIEQQPPVSTKEVKNTFSSELQNKKKLMESLKLQHQILMNRSKMLEIEAEISQMESQMNRSPQQTPEIVSKPPPSSNKEAKPASNKKKQISKSTKKAIKEQQQASETIISSESIKPIKVQLQQQEQSQEQPKQIEINEQDNESQYQVKTKKTRRTKAKPNKKRGNSSKKYALQVKNKMPIGVKSNPKIYEKKIVQQKEEVALKIAPKSKNHRYRLKKSQEEEEFIKLWNLQQERFLVTQLLTIKVGGYSKLYSQFVKRFGKKDRFNIESIKQKRTEMFKTCRVKFLAQLQKRQLFTDEEFKNIAKHLHCLDQRYILQFSSKFLQIYYFSNIDTMPNKAFKETYNSILKLKKMQSNHGYDKGDQQAKIKIGQSQSYSPSQQEYSNPPEQINKKALRRQITRLGLTDSDIAETRKLMNFNKKIKEQNFVRQQQKKAPKESDMFFSDDLSDQKEKEKEEMEIEEEKEEKDGSKIKSAFQKYIEEKEKCID